MKRGGEQRGDQRGQQKHSSLPEDKGKKGSWRVHHVRSNHFTAT